MTGRVFRQADIVHIKNTTSAARDRFNVLGVDSPLITPTQNEDAFKNRVVLMGSMPDKAKHFGRLAILYEPIRAGEIGQAWLSGICPAKVNVIQAGHQFADLIDSDATALRSGHAGSAQILWHEGQGYGKWAIVRLGIPALVRRFEFKQTLHPGSWATAHPFDISGAADTDPAAEFDVFDAIDGTLRGRGRTADSARQSWLRPLHGRQRTLGDHRVAAPGPLDTVFPESGYEFWGCRRNRRSAHLLGRLWARPR